MSNNRLQKNITIPDKAFDYVLKHLGKIHLKEIAGNIGESYNKVRKNLMVFGAISTTPKSKFFNDNEFQY